MPHPQLLEETESGQGTGSRSSLCEYTLSSCVLVSFWKLYDLSEHQLPPFRSREGIADYIRWFGVFNIR